MVPLLNLIRHGGQSWLDLLAMLGEPADTSIHFEYPLPLPRPIGITARTDAVLLSPARVLVLEAKWTEPDDETVAEYLAQTRRTRADPEETVRGWLSSLRPFARRTLKLGDFGGVGCQTLHRAASAGAVAKARGAQPALIHLHFHPSPLTGAQTTRSDVGDLQHLVDLLGWPPDFSMAVVELPLRETTAFRAIRGLKRGTPRTVGPVIAALTAGPLFEFGLPSVCRI